MTQSRDTVDPAVWAAKTLPELEAWLRDLADINLNPTSSFTAALRRKRAEAAAAFTATRIRMANESALGVYTFTWTSPAGDGAKVGVTWCEGWTSGPEASWAMPGDDRPPRHRPVASPERFGWAARPPPGRPSRRCARSPSGTPWTWSSPHPRRR